MKTIILRKENNIWTATYLNSPEIKEIFGSNTIPTAFDASVGAKYVYDFISSRNKDHKVIVEVF